MTQHQLLERLESDLKTMLEDVRTTVATLPDEAMRQRPSMEMWNIYECFAHLNFFSDRYFATIELAIHKSKARRWMPAEPVRYTLMARSDIKRANPYNDKKFKTKKKYDFIHLELNKNEIKRFIINTERLLRFIEQSKEVDINKAKIGRGPSGFFKYTLGNILEWMVLHAQRHMAQVKNLLKLSVR